MQIKYLTLAMTAALALNLTACKDDKKSSDKTDTKPVVSTPVASNPTTPVASTPVSNPSTTPSTPTSGPVSGINNVGQAATGGDLQQKYSAGTQQYTRNSRSAFDLVNNPRKATKAWQEDGSTSATNFVKLQNREMANLVLARNSTLREEGRTTFFIGTQYDRDNAESLQVYNHHGRTAAGTGVSAALEANYVNASVKTATGITTANFGKGVITSSSADVTNPDSGLVYVGNAPTSNGSTANVTDISAPSVRPNVKDNMYKLVQTLSTPASGNTPAVFVSKYYDANGNAITGTPTQNVVGKEELMTQSLSRVFGASYLPFDQANTAPGTLINNSVMYSNLSGEYKKKSSATNGMNGINTFNQSNSFLNGVEEISLKNVQYGRVTANLDAVQNIDRSNSPKIFQDGDEYYYQIDVNDYSTGGDVARFLSTTVNDVKAVNNYFYRGINRSGTGTIKAIPKTGKAKYAGHAIMYGIDNSFHGGNSNLNSNSIGTPSGVLEAVGNFVQATVDFQKQDVTGSVYNVWHQTDGSVIRDDLVKFNGKIVGKNNVAGTASRTYVANDAKADFQASFYGNYGAEMGGSFNTIKLNDKRQGGFGVVNWGGVFGAKQLAGGSGFETENQ